VATGGVIALPYEAFDPKLKELSEDFSLPTSPTLVSGDTRVTGQSYSGNTNVRLKPPSPRQQQLADKLAEQLSQEAQETNSESSIPINVTTPPSAEVGMETSDSVNDDNDPSGLRPDS
jgi:hypothetical protein